MSRIIRFTLITASFAALSVVVGKAESEPPPIIVRAITIHPVSTAEATYLTGEVRARVQSDLSFRVNGRIVERHVNVGDKVKAGDLLARLDAEEQKADINVARANLESAEAELKLVDLAYIRQLNLIKTRVTTQAAIDQAKENLATSRENVISAAAKLDNAKQLFGYTELRADADGVITARNAEVGQIAKAAQPIFTLARKGELDGVFDVQETLYLQYLPADKLALSLISGPTREITGTIREISPTIDGLTGTIKVKVSLGEEQNWALGAPIVGAFKSPQRSTIEVPWSALTFDGDVPAVWSVDPVTQTVSLRRITIGKYGTSSVEVADGISVGDTVVVDGGKFLSPGRAVQVKSETER
jgi:RND family efflux transporter MFP subunit